MTRTDLRYPLDHDRQARLTPTGPSWSFAAPTDGGGSEALVHLLRLHRLPVTEGFLLRRLVHPPEATGERPLDDDARTVVVGERVVVAWARTVNDVPYSAPETLAHLAAVDFLGIPDTYGMLLWTTPQGHRAPLAVATKYLPRSVDGRQCLSSLFATGGPAAEEGETPALTSRMGRITAALHVALATPSEYLTTPSRAATVVELQQWHHHVLERVDRARLLLAEADGDVPGLAPGTAEQLVAARADADALAAVAAQVDADPAAAPLVQRVHGDLHLGRFRRWAAGLMITGFGDEPENGGSGLGEQPPAREAARLLHGLTRFAEQISEQVGGVTPEAAAAWAGRARERVLDAYRTEAEVGGRPDLLDERLLAAFEAEHLARTVIDTCRAARQIADLT